LKLVFFPFGLYRPRQSLEDLPDLVTAIQHLAEKKSGLIIWVQHHSLSYAKLWLERKIYSRFYKDIIKEIYTHQSPHFKIITLEKSFLVQENFLLDGLHLSALGHQRMADLIYSEIESALTEAREYIKNQEASL
jgi:lysophospholipase L1-like esterase